MTYRGSWSPANLVAEEKEEGELADGKKETARRHSSEKEENVEKQKRQKQKWGGGRPWQQQQSERGKQRCRVSRINVRQCDTSEKQKGKRLKTGGGSVGG